MQKFIHFIKYHNAFAIGASLIFTLMAGTFAASPDLRNSLISSQDIVSSVDNSGVVAADFTNFDFALQIKEITEDENNYYVVYIYRTMAIQDYIWQEVKKEDEMTVSKSVLGDSDLGLYVAEELGEVLDYQLSYLKEVQQLQKKSGLTQKVVATQYTGLIGRLLSTKEKVFPEYQSLVKESEVQPQEIATSTDFFNPSVAVNQETANQQTENIQPFVQQPVIEGSINRELIRQIVQEMLSQQQGRATFSVSESTIPTPGSTSTPPPTQEITPATEPVEPTSTSQTATSTEPVPPVCSPDWQCSDWQSAPETQNCGQTFTQTRTCADSNNCGIDEGKPAETQSVSGVKCEASNATGVCQSGSCNFTCAGGFSNCDNNWLNGCEIRLETSTSTCPIL